MWRNLFNQLIENEINFENDPFQDSISYYGEIIEPETEYYDHYDDCGCWVEEISVECTYCEGQFYGDVSSEDGFEEVDYLEGLDENLDGIKW